MSDKVGNPNCCFLMQRIMIVMLIVSIDILMSGIIRDQVRETKTF